MGDSRRRLPRGTVTFLFSDIEGSTKLAQQLDPKTYRVLLEKHHRLLRAAFAAHGGVERGTQGDAFLVIFRDARSAVAAAIQAQRALVAASWPQAVDVRVRMGLHSGEGIAGGDDYVGMDVNRAARIAAAAHGGQILVSDATRALAERDLPEGVRVLDLGHQQLRDLDRAEHLFQLLAIGLHEEFPPLRAAVVEHGALPPALTSFIGRERELAEARALLATSRLLTLIGPSGTGKTRLAIELARQLEGAERDGVWFAPLAGVADHRRVANALAAAVGVGEVSGKPVESVLVDYLRGRRGLLVLDNFEHVLPAAALVDEILRTCPRIRAAVTSQVALRLSEEQLYPVPPLAMTSNDSDLGASEAVRLFAERAARVRPEFRLTPENTPAIAAICRRLDGLPLAIELAAARVRILSVENLLARLDKALEILGAGPGDAPERHRTLRGAIAWSYGLLEPTQAVMFRRLSVFAGGSSLDAIERVTSEGMDSDALTVVDDLVGHSLVIADVSGSETRFRMLETIREFAAAQLAAEGEADAVRRRHAEFYRDLAERFGRERGRFDVDLSLALDAEIDNLRAALRWALDERDSDIGLRICGSSWRFWKQRGHLRECREWCEAFLALPAAEGLERPRMAALGALGGLAYWLADRAGSLAAYEAHLRLAERVGGPPDVADASFDLTFGFVAVGKLEEARASAARAHAIYEELGDEVGLARSDWQLNSMLVPFGERSAADRERLRDVTLPVLQRHGDLLYQGIVTGDLAWTAIGQGDVEEARRWGRESISVYRAARDVPSMLVTLRGAALLVRLLDRPAAAARIDTAADALSKTYGIGFPVGLGEVLRIAGWKDGDAALTRSHGTATDGDGARMTVDEAVEFALENL